MTSVYAILLEWPDTDIVLLGAPQPASDTSVRLLGYKGEITWSPRGGQGLEIQLPVLNIGQMPCQWAWVFQLDNLKNGPAATG